MKILIITSGHQPSDDRIYHKEIITLLEAGHRVVLLTKNQSESLPNHELFQHIDYNVGSSRVFINKAVDYATEFNPDKVIVHEMELLPLGLKIKKKINAVFIYDIHEAHIEMWDAFSTKPTPIKNIINWGLRVYEQYHLRSVDRALSPSPVIVNRYRQNGIKTYFIPNYPRLIPPQERETSHTINLIYHGQISTERGIGDLIEAVSLLKGGEQNIKLDIYGKERLHGTVKSFEKQVQRLGLERVISFHDSIPHDEIIEKIQDADIGVIPFRDLPMFRVAVPIKLFEYMMCNCAVIAGDLPLMREFAKENIDYFQTGNIQNMSKKLNTLIVDEIRRNTLKRAGREIVERKYNWAHVEPTFLNAVNS